VLLVHLQLGLLEDMLIEVLLLLDGLTAKLCPQFHLLIQHLTNLFHSVLVVCLLSAYLILVQFLPELLDLAPFVIADVRWQILDLN